MTAIGQGLITQRELAHLLATGEEPQHALQFQLPGTNHTARWPSFRTESRGNTPVPMGGLWRINPDLDPATLPAMGSVNATLLRDALVRMCQRWGAIVNDTTGGNINFRMESISSGSFGGGSLANRVFSWGNVFSAGLKMDDIMKSIPVDQWQMISANYRTGVVIPDPRPVEDARIAAGEWTFFAAGTDGIDVQGRVVLTPTSATDGSVAYPTGGLQWSIQDSEVFAEVVQVQGTFGAFGVWPGGSPNANNMRFVITPGTNTILAATKYNSSTVAGFVQTTWDPVAHRFLKLRVAGGVMYWETSPDAQTWTQMNSLTVPGTFWDLTTVIPGFQAQGSGTGKTMFQNLNVVPAPVPVSTGWTVGVA